jgi:hypothetical protein
MVTTCSLSRRRVRMMTILWARQKFWNSTQREHHSMNLSRKADNLLVDHLIWAILESHQATKEARFRCIPHSRCKWVTVSCQEDLWEASLKFKKRLRVLVPNTTTLNKVRSCIYSKYQWVPSTFNHALRRCLETTTTIKLWKRCNTLSWWRMQ